MKKYVTIPSNGRGIASIGKLFCSLAALRRFWAVCVMVVMVSLPAFAQNQKNITVEVNGATVATVISQIEAQSGYAFFYNTKDVDLNRNITLSLKNSDLNGALTALFKGANVTWTIDNNQVILKKAATTKADHLTGRVIDNAGQPVIGASVVIEGTLTGVTTGIDGDFTFPWNAELSKSTLEVSFIGYATQNIAVGGRTNIEVVLLEDTKTVETVVVTALGIKKSERAVSYNVQNIATDDVFKAKDASLVNNLAGKVAGVNINASSTGIGGETKVEMRGAKSIYGNNQALYVLDGIPLPQLSMTDPSSAFSSMRTENPSGDGIAAFNPDDIGNMSVLTGPSSAALYGSKAANGVIMLSTRTAEKGVSVSYSNNTTFMTPLILPKFQRRYGTANGSDDSWNTSRMTKKSSWDPEDFFQTGYNTTNTVALAIGGEHSSTYLSGSVVKAEGIIPNNEFNRYNFTVNHSHKFLKDKMTLSVLGMYMNINEQNMLANGQYYNPLVPIYLMSPDADLMKYATYERYDASRNFKTQYWDRSDVLAMQNPYWVINRDMFNNQKNRFILGATLKYDITDYLDITGRARIDYTDMLAEQKNYASTNGLFAGENGRYYHHTYKTTQKYGDVMLNFHKHFIDDKLSLNVMLGASIEDMKYRAVLIGGDLAKVPNLFTFANMDNGRAFSQKHYNDQTQSIFGTIQLGYKNMLFLDFTARNDWSTSLVNTKSLSMFYPSVGLSAVLTDIFKCNSNWFSYAKVRASYAEVGNAPMRYITIPTYSVSTEGPQTSTYLTAENYEPERTKSWEVGADVRLWGNKLVISATYYTAKTTNQIFNPQISSTSTHTSMYVNAGRVDNHGVELTATLNQKLGQDGKWESNIIYTRNRNKIKSMLHDYKIGGEVITQDSMVMGGLSGVKMVIREGGRMGDIYVNTMRTDEHGNIYVSLNGDVVTDPNHFIYAGNTNPAYTLSWRNNFSWKGIQFGFMLNARVGGIGVSMTQAALDSYGVSEVTGEARDKGGALINGQRVGNVKAYYQAVGNMGDGIGSQYVYSMTNVRMGEITLGYDLPVQKWCKWIKGLNVSFVARNPFLIYCKAPFDPESIAGTGNYNSGIEYFQQPSLRTFGFSVKATF